VLSHGVKAFRWFAELLGIGSLDQLAHSLFAQRFTRLVALQQVDHDLTEARISERITSASGLGAGPATASSNA
jgi:hypothetical protein